MSQPSFFNRVVEYTTTTGTGTITTTGVAAVQCSTFANGVPTGSVLNYLLLSGDQINWEIGQSTVTVTGSTATLTRTAVLQSTNANTPINLTGQSTVSCIADTSVLNTFLNNTPTDVSSTTGSTNLTAQQALQPIIVQTGVLTANVTYVVPNTWMGLWVNNSTGAFTTTVKTAAGTGVPIPQGSAFALIADGTNVNEVTTSILSNVSMSGTISGAPNFAGAVTFSGTGANSATGVTQTTGDNSTKLATTAFVDATAANYLLLSGGTLVGDVTFTAGNLIFNELGFAAPTFTTKSSGTRVVFASYISSSSVDFADGMAPGTKWSSIPQNTNAYSFQWFGGITEIASLDGTGAANFVTSVTSPSITATAQMVSVTPTAGDNSTKVATTAYVDAKTSRAVIAAAGTTQGTATRLTAAESIITSGTGGVIVPALPLTAVWVIWNRSGASLNVYPDVGAQLETLGLNLPEIIANNSKVTVAYTTSTQGYIG